MSRISMLRDGLRGAGVAAITVFFCAPALAGEIYSWRTEDGGYAYTDDAKAIPPRYRAQAASRQSDGLGSYKRLTSPSPGSTDAYAQRLANRLQQLRTQNRDYELAMARPQYQSQVGNIEVDTGSLNVGVPVDDDSDAPVVIETIRFRYDDEMATRHNLVVKKGDRILTVIKGKPLVSDINQAPDISRMTAD